MKSPPALISEIDKSPSHPVSPAVTHIDASLIPLPDTEPSTRSSSQSLVTTSNDQLINKGFSLESSVDPPSLTVYMSSPLSSITSTGSNVAMTIAAPIGSFSFNSQKLLSPAEFVSSPPHSLSSFSKVTPSDFSSALPLVASSTAVAAPATPTSIGGQTPLAPPPITCAEDSSITEVTMESSSDSDYSDGENKVTPQDTAEQSAKNSFQDTSETMEVPKPVLVTHEPVFHVEDDKNKLVTSLDDQTNMARDELSPQLQQNSGLVSTEGKLSQTPSDFASANDEESEFEDLATYDTNNLVDNEPDYNPQSKVDSLQLFPDTLPAVTVQPIRSDGNTTNNNVQFIQCDNCSTFNSSQVLQCSHCGRAKNDQWTPKNFPKAVPSEKSEDNLMIAQSPSTVDAAATSVSVSSSMVEPSAAAVDNNMISHTAVLTAAPDHGKVLVHANSPWSAPSSIHATTTAEVAVVTSSVKSTVTLDSSSSVEESNTHSMNHQEPTR